MRSASNTLLPCLALALGCLGAAANERNFTYSYEPETMPQGAWEYEQWVTSRAGRSAAGGQEDYRKWEFRHELEYGVTDNYTLGVYLNESFKSYHDTGSGDDYSKFRWDGISLENRYMVLNPAEKPVGLTLYLEPTIAHDQAELEQKIILGQRHGEWKWALNLIHATEWEDDFKEVEGELEASFGLTRHLGPRWSVGVEARDHNALPKYERWENTAVYVGPVVRYSRESWWATLTVMPQVYGANFDGNNPDGNRHLELADHERWNIRLLFGFHF